MWVYIFFVGINIFTGVFSIWFLDAPEFFIYLVILIYYFGAINKLYYDSKPFRTLGEKDNDSNYYIAPQ